MKRGDEMVLFRFNNGNIVPQRVEIAEIGLRKGRGVILMGEPPEGLEEELQDEAASEGESDGEK